MKLFCQVAVVGTLIVFAACGGGTSAPHLHSGPSPAVAAISPNSSTQGGPAFTLSVVGSNFTANSIVQWNGAAQPTTFVSKNLVTAAIPAGEVVAPGPDNVAVVDTGATSNALSFAVPCVIPTLGGSSQQTRARLGAYYFDGWSGPLTNFHFQGLPLGPFQDRQPLSGGRTTASVRWSSNSPSRTTSGSISSSSTGTSTPP